MSSVARLGTVSALLMATGCGGIATGEPPGGLGGSLIWTGSPPDAGSGGSGVAGTSGQPGPGGEGGAAGTASGGSGGGEGGEQGDAGTDPGHAGAGRGGAGSAGPDAGPPENLIPNPSFEDGHAGWEPFGGAATLVDSEEDPHTGSKCLATQNRLYVWNGPLLDIVTLLQPGTEYDVSVWVRIASGEELASLTLRMRCQYDAGVTYVTLATVAAGVEWTELRGQFTSPACMLETLDVYVEGPPPGVDLYIDDAGLFVAEP